MKIRVLGCSGAISKDCRTTSFMVDGDVLIDAGTGVGDLTLNEMRGIRHVLLTHSHLDHVAALPLMVDAIASHATMPVQIHALADTISALKTHIFNDVIWPDFSQIPDPEAPLISFHEIEVGDTLELGGKLMEVLPAVHSVPAIGFALNSKQGHWVFSGDTERNPGFWARINQLDVAMLVIETAFSNKEKNLAQKCLHLSPHALAQELACIAPGKEYPIYITHTKPSETDLIMTEIQRFVQPSADGFQGGHDIRWLRAGQEFEL
jgi:ribonuclease BN (tRNA processing enzyme)